MCTCECVPVCVCMYKCVSACACVCVCRYKCVSACACVYMHSYVHVCVCVCRFLSHRKSDCLRGPKVRAMLPPDSALVRERLQLTAAIANFISIWLGRSARYVVKNSGCFCEGFFFLDEKNIQISET